MTRREQSTPRACREVDLVDQDSGLHDHTVADDRRDEGVQDPAGQQLQGKGLAVDHDRVPCVVAALVAHHHLHLLGQQVGQLSLTLVTPLGADQDGRGHAWALLLTRRYGRA